MPVVFINWPNLGGTTRRGTQHVQAQNQTPEHLVFKFNSRLNLVNFNFTYFERGVKNGGENLSQS